MPTVISDNFVRNAFLIGERMRERRKEKKISNAMAGWDEDPESVVQEVFKIDRNAGMELAKTYQEKQAALAEAAETRRKGKMETFKRVVGFLDAADDDPERDIGVAYQQVAPILKNTFEMPDEEIAYYGEAIKQNPALVKALAGKMGDDKPYVVSAGSHLVGPDGKPMFSAPFAPKDQKTIEVPNAKGGVDLYVFDPSSGTFKNSGGGSSPGAGAAPTGFDAFYDRFLAGAEGGYTPDDGNGAPANFGINQKYHPGVDVKSLTQPQAKEIYRNDYWNKFVTPDMSPALQAVHADTAINMGPDDAAALMTQSGGDPNRYIQLRRERYKTKPGYSRFKDTWNRRMDDLQSFITGGGQPAPIISTTGGNKDRARQLSDAEVKTRRLDPRWRWQEMPNGETKIIGPAGAAGKGTQSLENKRNHTIAVIDKMNQLAATAKQVRDHKGLPRITGLMGVFPNIPGGDAANAEAKLDKLKSQVSLSVLQLMRDMSKTGGALGNVSNYEIKVLENNLASLEKAQSVDEFRNELNSIVDWADRASRQIRVAAEEDGVDFGNAKAGRASPDGIPDAAKSLLKNNPSGAMRLQFDQKYGKGAARRVLGN
jgi:hypothetical protein